MNLAHLKYAVEVEKTGSITRAADNLFMGQPNLSKAIKELEAQVGIAIFRRTSKGVAPTRKGQEFLAYAKAILAQIDEMEAIYRPSDERIRFHVAIPRASYLSHAFTRFVNTLDLQKEMDITFKETNSLDAIAGVAESESILGIIRYGVSQEYFYKKQLEEKALAREILWEFDPLVLLSREHPLANKERITSEDLREYIELVHGDLENPKPLALADARRNQAEQQKKKSISVYERGSQFDLLTGIPKTYMWVSPLPEEILGRYDLCQRKCSGAERYRDVLIYQKGYQLTETDQAFLAKIRQVQGEIVAKEE